MDLRNWELLKLSIETYPRLLIRLKLRNPQKRAFVVRQIALYIDDLQREEKEQTATHENSTAYIMVLEEAQGIFTVNSQNRTESEEFLGMFNEARNQKIAFVTASQRLTDFSRTIRSKQQLVLGKLSPEDLTPFLRKIEKKFNLVFANMTARKWFFENSVITAPDFRQNGKPFIINSEIRQKWLDMQPKTPEKKTLAQKILDWLTGKESEPKTPKSNTQKFFVENEEEKESEEFEDLALIGNDLLGE
jgi:hypothetical protein